MKCFLISTAILAVLAAIGAILFIYSGIYDVSAKSADPALERWALHTTMLKSAARAGEKLPRPSDQALKNPENIRAGLNHYDAMCMDCHGAPGIKPQSSGFELYPEPPDLAGPASEMKPRTLFWIVKNGIKMTGMPAWSKALSDKQIWDVVAFLKQLPGMTPKQYDQLLVQEATAERKSTPGH